MTDYYKVLGVNAWATDKEIKASYRKLAKQYHPDVTGEDPVKAGKMYVIQEAYNILSDPKQREAYNARSRDGASGAASGASGGAACTHRGGQGPDAGRSGAPVSDRSRFEQFFGFQPGKGMEPGRDKKTDPEGTIKPEEMFASFFGKIKR